MYCSECGSSLSENARFCGGCGAEIIWESGTISADSCTSGGRQLIGFSEKINDPAFEKYRKDSRSWSYLFSVILAIIAVIGFPIYGEVSGELEMPTSFYYGLGIGGMFIFIAFLQSMKRRLDSTWDGTVIDKDSYRRTKRNRQTGSRTHYMEYIFKVKRDNGKVYKHKNTNLPGLFNYYNVGDKVRHHKGFYYYEKYDKSQDSQILCAACLSLNEPERDYCFRCKCPILK